jgi:hypothetical protein
MDRTQVTKVLLSLIALAGLSSVASASPITYNGLGYHSTVRIHAPGRMADGWSVPAGQMLVTWNQTNFAGYCIDLDHYAASGDVTPRNVLELPRGQQLAWLFETYVDEVVNNTSAAAMQAAMWELMYETCNTFSVTDGSFTITSNDAAANLANDWLAETVGSYSPQSTYMILDGLNNQDILIQVQGSDVPEPTAMVTLALGGLLMVARRRRRMRQAV